MKEGYKVSEKTVGNYMRQLGIKAHYIKPVYCHNYYSSLDDKLKNILNRDFNPEKLMPTGVLTLLIFGQKKMVLYILQA